MTYPAAGFGVLEVVTMLWVTLREFHLEPHEVDDHPVIDPLLVPAKWSARLSGSK